MGSKPAYVRFEEFFERATGDPPYPYQKRLAESPIPDAIDVPTGAGKTAAAVLGMWLWHRLNDTKTPRRLAYCLPRRTLVEQTVSKVRMWLKNLGLGDRIGVIQLMGGDSDRDYEMYPAKECIIIGTQDMLVSGALNRAYGSSPYRWPMFFGLLNNDCLWVMDEVQIMENALPTSVQLDAFRRSMKTFGPHHTVWMSATINPEWLKTIDSPSDKSLLRLGERDRLNDDLKGRNGAVKNLHRAEIELKKTYGNKDAEYLCKLHQKGTATAVIVNTVQRAQNLYDAITRRGIDCRLIHSRFRAADRRELNDWIGETNENEDRIIISTQVLEAGVDISVRTLVTELAPWSSLVQRFGRCNRRGTLKDADVYWIDIPGEKDQPPYEPDDMMQAREKLRKIADGSVSPGSLPQHDEPKVADVVLRRRDVCDLFDTTPDLSGNYIDASRFVRTMRRHLDVDVFWRGDDKKSMPESGELCSVPISELKSFLKGRLCRVWNHGDGEWEVTTASGVFPGQTVMLDSKDGGYSETRGWDKELRDEVNATGDPKGTNDSHGADSQSQSTNPVTLECHTIHVLRESCSILEEIGFVDKDIKDAVTEAARYHDVGKAHSIFQDTMRRGMTEAVDEGAVWAKSQKVSRHKIPGFRHEMAGALAYLGHSAAPNPMLKDLAAYLIASHHGKVRLSLRNVSRKNPNERYLLGMDTSGDSLPEFSSSVVKIGKTSIDMSIAQIGRTDSGASWTERMLALMGHYGPFRLAYLELLVRAADALASSKERSEK